MLILLANYTTMAKANLKPGQPAPKSGQYETVGPKGGKGNINKKKTNAFGAHPQPVGQTGRHVKSTFFEVIAQ